MRELNVKEIEDAVREMCISSNYNLPADIYKKLSESVDNEESAIGKGILKNILINADLAKKNRVPICQDTGMAILFIEIGQEVCLLGGDFEEAVNEGVRKGYSEGYLRKSIVRDPLLRDNTGDNTPAVIHLKIVPGDRVKIVVAPKGFGSENMSRIKMLKPSDGMKGVEDFVLQAVSEAGPNPCPPIFVGVGIGGTFEKVAEMAKRALLREVEDKNPDPSLAEMETRLFEKINDLGIGPQGLGGRTTALAVKVETYPTHIAGLPAAVAINCHATRHEERIL
ncbi:MAG: fumarate hydratase [Peptostreptococcaceae bacterium]|nr:fumarate hydratase [Peptostreptococcaceae bacterium]